MASKDPVISIIIPVYNTEKYLRRCLDSIVAQTYKDFECILVDDGSTDGSGMICDEYTKRDSRFKVIHKENEGVSAARNDGVSAASGEWIAFADSDDWMERNMLEELMNKTSEGCDIVMCDYYRQYSLDGVEYMILKPKSLDHTAVMEDLFSGNLMGALWNKLIRRSCFERYNIQFPTNISFMEDIFVICSMLLYEVKVGYVAKALYHYNNINTGTNLSGLMYDRNSKKDIEGLTYFIDFFEDRIKNPRTKLYLQKRKIFYKLLIWNKKYRTKSLFIDKYSEVNKIMIKQVDKMSISMKLALTKGYYLGAVIFYIGGILKQLLGKR